MLSKHDCAWQVRQANLRNFVKMCRVHSSHNVSFCSGRLATLGYTKPTCSSHRLSQGLLIRVFFILGNLTASNSDNRRLLVLRLSALPMLGSVLTRVKTFILCCIPWNTPMIPTLDSRLQRSCCIRKKQNRVSRKWCLAVSKAHTDTFNGQQFCARSLNNRNPVLS